MRRSRRIDSAPKNEQGVMPNEFGCVGLLTKFEPHEAIAKDLGLAINLFT